MTRDSFFTLVQSIALDALLNESSGAVIVTVDRGAVLFRLSAGRRQSNSLMWTSVALVSSKTKPGGLW